MLRVSVCVKAELDSLLRARDGFRESWARELRSCDTRLSRVLSTRYITLCYYLLHAARVLMPVLLQS